MATSLLHWGVRGLVTILLMYAWFMATVFVLGRRWLM